MSFKWLRHRVIFVFYQYFKIGKCLLHHIAWLSVISHLKRSEIWGQSAFWAKPMCQITFMFLCVYSNSFCRYTSHKTVIDGSPSLPDGNPCLVVTSRKSMQLVFYHLHVSFFFYWEFSCLHNAEWILERKRQDGCVINPLILRPDRSEIPTVKLEPDSVIWCKHFARSFYRWA